MRAPGERKAAGAEASAAFLFVRVGGGARIISAIIRALGVQLCSTNLIIVGQTDARRLPDVFLRLSAVMAERELIATVRAGASGTCSGRATCNGVLWGERERGCYGLPRGWRTNRSQ